MKNIVKIMLLTLMITAGGIGSKAVAGILDDVPKETKQDLKITALLEKANLLDYNISIHDAKDILGDPDVKLKFFPSEDKDTYIWENKTSLFNKEYLLVLFEDYQLHSIHYHDGKDVNLNYGSRKDAEDIIHEGGNYSFNFDFDIPPVPPIPGIPAVADKSFFLYKMIDLKDDLSQVVGIIGAPSEITSGPDIDYIWKYDNSEIIVRVKDGKVFNKRIKSSSFNNFIEIETIMEDANTTITNINLDKLK